MRSLPAYFGCECFVKYMIYKNILFCMLSFAFVDGFFCCSQAFQFSVVPLVCLLFCCLCYLCQVQKVIIKTDAKKLTDQLSFQFCGFGFFIEVFNLFWIDFCTWCKIVAWFNSSCVSFLFNFYFEYGCFTIFYQFQGYSKVISLYKYIHISIPFQILFPYRLLQNIEQNSLG